MVFFSHKSRSSLSHPFAIFEGRLELRTVNKVSIDRPTPSLSRLSWEFPYPWIEGNNLSYTSICVPEFGTCLIGSFWVFELVLVVLKNIYILRCSNVEVFIDFYHGFNTRLIDRINTIFCTFYFHFISNIFGFILLL